MTNTPSIPGSNVGKARRTFSQLWQVPTFLIGLLALIGVAVSAPWRISPQEREFDKLVQVLRTGLEQNEAPDVLVAHAEGVRLWLQQHPGRSAEAHFLVGSAYYRQAKQKPAVAKEAWPLAVEHLKAAERGVATRDRAALQYRLGYALYQQNSEVPRALELMRLGVDQGAEQPLAGYQLLIDAHMKRTPPDVEAALSAVRRILDLTPQRDADAITQARLQHADLLLRKGARAEALDVLNRIGPKAPQAMRVKARLLQAIGCEQDEQWGKAIPHWEELLKDAAHVEGGRVRILYSLGRCYEQADSKNPAKAIKPWSEASRLGGLGGLEGQAAGLRLGQLRLGQGEFGPALADWQTALEKVNEPADYRNPLVDVKELHEWFGAAIRRFDEMQDPEKTQMVAELFRKVAPPGVAEGLIAEAAEALAVQLEQKSMFEITREMVHIQYRRAGKAHEQAAQARAVAERPESLWRSAHCYKKAHEPALAQQVLMQFVKLEIKEDRLAEGWHTLGDLYRTEGQRADAHRAYVKCLEYPNTPFAYRSRYFLAVEEYDNKRLEKAKEILDQNLSAGPTIDIERAWQEKSQFLMASLLLDMKQFAQAQIHLNDCIVQFPENPNVPKSRLQLGECYRELAKKERAKEIEIQRSAKPGMPEEQMRITEETMRRHRQARSKLLQDALRMYQQLADELGPQSNKKPLNAHEQMLLRRALLGVGETYLDADQYDDALQTFRALQLNHRRTMEGLFASPLICYVLTELQGQQLPKEKIEFVREAAMASIRLLMEDLKALPADHEVFRMSSMPPRDGWLRWAEETQKKLQMPPRNDGGLPAIR